MINKTTILYFIPVLAILAGFMLLKPGSIAGDIEEAFAVTDKSNIHISDRQFVEPGSKSANKKTQTNFITHAWTELGLIAHGGGGILDLDTTNCYEAIITNYNNGHRVFEIDLNLTSDKQLAAVHDWHGYGGAMPLEQWRQVKIAEVFTSMDLDYIYSIMQANDDFYLVTDTKSFEYTEAEVILQLELLRDLALERDPELLSRVVPQIYNQRMYELITEIYPFKSIIYTLYESPDSDAQVVEFVKDKDDIKVITMAPTRYSDEFMEQLKRYDKRIYLFTLNDPDEISKFKRLGVHGFYTDFITPAQFHGLY